MSVETVIRMAGFTTLGTVRPHTAHINLRPHIPKNNLLFILSSWKWK